MNPRTCNRPITTTDANNNVTDYTYAPEHGGVLTETGPAVPTRQNNGTMANVRPQKRYEYAQRTAWTSNGVGGYVAGPPIWLLMRERSCRATAGSGTSCAGGAADEVLTEFDYGPNSGPNTLLLRGQAVTSTDNGVTTTLRTCYGYDGRGNRISETRPNGTVSLTSCP
jgi:YD repeat-containing protein